MYQGIDATIGESIDRSDSAHRTISHPHETAETKQPAVCRGRPLQEIFR